MVKTNKSQSESPSFLVFLAYVSMGPLALSFHTCLPAIILYIGTVK